MASVKIILRKDKEDKTGACPLYLRIIKNRKVAFTSIDLKCKPIEWDQDRQRIKKNHRNSGRLNAVISDKVAKAEWKMAEYLVSKQEVTTKNLIAVIAGKEPENYFDFVYKRLEKNKLNMKYGVWKSYYFSTKKLEKFVGSSNLFFPDISVKFLNAFKDWMIHERKNNPTTIAFTFKIIRKYFREAIQEEYTSSSYYPFDKVKTTFPMPIKDYLSKSQIESLKNIPIKKSSNGKYFRDMFVFSCFAGGLRFADVVELQWQNYKADEQRIVKIIRKTGRLHQIKITSEAAAILSTYKSELSKPTDFIFPLLEENPEYFKNGEYHYNTKAKVLKNANNHLKLFGKMMGLPFSLTFHASRHTFATQALNNGMRIEHVSKLMDHCNIGVTQVYAKIIDKELDKAVMDAFEKKN